MQHILLVISGSIAAYKSPTLCNRLQDLGYKVRIIMTSGACKIITRQSLEAVCKDAVYLNHEDSRDSQPMLHIDLAKWAQLIVVAPASANQCARLASGMADDLIGSTYLASQARIMLAPAMNNSMWKHPATQRNIDLLQARPQHHILAPAAGAQACGDSGSGRMPEAEDIAKAVQQLAMASHDKKTRPEHQPLQGLRIMLNAGPTHEYIDSMRLLGNRSSGKMGYALAHAAQQLGANVTLISGPTQLRPPPGVSCECVTSAQQMLDACQQQASQHDLFIACAAIADYRPAHPSPQKKIKKTSAKINLELIKNPDIIATIAQQFPALRCIGFAAETHDIERHAANKLTQKKLHAIIATPIDRTISMAQQSSTDSAQHISSGPQSDYSSAILIDINQKTSYFENQEKTVLAKKILLQCLEDEIINKLAAPAV